MYPSTNNNGYYSFSSTSNIQPITFSSFYDSQPPRDLYGPPFLSAMEDGTIVSDNLQGNASSEPATHDIWASLGKCNSNNGDAENYSSSTTRKSNSKKDRHSKINTAQGPRDRRMRLSLEVAKKFFKLQDLLGFDKASKTVEWLLMKSTSGIQELLPHHHLIPASNSDCEDIDVDDDQCMVKSSSSSNNKEKKKRGIRKNAYLLRPLAKEIREKARARARERTMVKSTRLACGGGGGGGGDQLSSFSPCLDPDLNLLDSCNFNRSDRMSARFQFKQGSIDNNWIPSLFNLQHSEHQVNEFQILGNLWETNN